MSKLLPYNFKSIEKKWRLYWEKQKKFQAEPNSKKPKYYVLDMFPYPSGAGLHTGHTLGYIASDVLARYKRSEGFNVLHPMGFDAFGLPAEKYAQDNGQHPKVTTAINIEHYKEQLKSLGLSFDWSREVWTSKPNYYCWTQWIFLQMFDSYYDKSLKKARPIKELVKILSTQGNKKIQAACSDKIELISSVEWNQKNTKAQEQFLNNYRLAFIEERVVNWCSALNSVLANEEVKEGLSERGGFPVEQKRMRQWALRIRAYADRLLEGLSSLDWSHAVKEMQKNWIGKSDGAEVEFILEDGGKLTVFTTKPETLFGVTFIAVAPDSSYLEQLLGTLKGTQRYEKVIKYQQQELSLSQRERLKNNDKISGVFTGCYAVHPFTKKRVPIWVANYVLGNYGSGAVMGVPAHDQRDRAFATHFDLPILSVINYKDDNEGKIINSPPINGLGAEDGKRKLIDLLQNNEKGSRKTTYRLKDAGLSRQRYWGEPIPIYFKDSIASPLSETQLPLQLPDIDEYRPTSDGLPPLARARGWEFDGSPLEQTTMPGWAGSSWYFLRYVDPYNKNFFASKEKLDYWNSVDLYIGGSEHATGHLIYARFFTKFLYDLGYLSFEEPFKKLINQGMIQGISHFVYRIKGSNTMVSYEQRDKYETTALYVDNRLIKNGGQLNIVEFKKWRDEYASAQFKLNKNGDYQCGKEVEKMSKSKYNTVSPDEMVSTYSADAFRLYMLFLGPITQSKPWDSHGIEGMVRFLKKTWSLFFPNNKGKLELSDAAPSLESRRILHEAIRRFTNSMETYKFNTAISGLMICVNELSSLGVLSKSLLEDFLKILAPFAPHICEELWMILGKNNSITEQKIPSFDPELLIKLDVTYPISIDGKHRGELVVPRNTAKEEVEVRALGLPKIKKWLNGREVKKVVVIPQRIVNIVTKK